MYHTNFNQISYLAVLVLPGLVGPMIEAKCFKTCNYYKFFTNYL